jgi:predicted ATPase
LDEPRLIVVTGGPGAGKTAVLEMIRKQLCKHVVILPEAASIIFSGGFWRIESTAGHESVQRAILSIQGEIEKLVMKEHKWSVALCDRGIPDGLAYWPSDEEAFWEAANTTLADEYKKYYSVIHLRTPTEEHGYNHQNPLRTETPQQAAEIDERIYSIWSKHPHYHMIDSTEEFLIKAQEAMKYIFEDLPECCK